MNKLGRPLRIQGEHAIVLASIDESAPTATLDEIGTALQRRTGIQAHRQTLVSALRKRVIQRVASSEAHRRLEPEQCYPSCLTDTEWTLVRDVFEREGGCGLPPRISRRALVDACCYVVRTGCAWRMLPTHFRRWSAQGKLEQMHDRLRAQWREREARFAEPAAAVLDAQSTRGSPRAGGAVTRLGRRLKAASATWSLICWGFYWRLASRLPAYRPCLWIGLCREMCAEGLPVHNIQVQVVRHPANKSVGRWSRPGQLDMFTVQANASGFVVLAKRWVVGRTHAWNERARRLVMHHDRLPRVAETWVWLTGARMLLRRLTV